MIRDYFIVGEYHLVEVNERARVRRGSEQHIKLTLKVADTFFLHHATICNFQQRTSTFGSMWIDRHVFAEINKFTKLAYGSVIKRTSRGR